MATNSAGIRITQAGISAPFAADYQYVFNSDWPSLSIAFEAVVDTSTSIFTTTKINHNLGFVPFFETWDVTGGVNNGRIAYYVVSADKNNLYINGTGLKYSIKCYNIDINKPVNYAFPKPPLFKTPYDPSTGIKVTKYDKSIGSKDLRDYILHSRAQSPAVLTILNQSTTSIDTMSYTNPAGYIPWAFAFTSTDGSRYVQISPGPTQGLPTFSFSYPGSLNGVGLNGKVVLAYSNNGVGTIGYGVLVILRDPLVVANTKQVTY